jgi:hypothetical protein
MRSCLFLVLPAVLAPSAWAQSAPTHEPVEVEAEIYLWAPSVAGRAGIGPLELPVNVTPGDLASGLKLGAMGRLGIRKGRASASLDVIGVDVERKRFAPVLGQDLSAEVGAIELVGGYRFDAGEGVSITPIAGFRYNNLRARFGTPPATLAVKGDWLEPALGVTVSARPAKRVGLEAKLIAGYRDTRRHSVGLRAEASYRVGRRTEIFAGYRYLEQKYRSGGGGQFSLDLSGDGPLVGFRRRF